MNAVFIPILTHTVSGSTVQSSSVGVWTSPMPVIDACVSSQQCALTSRQSMLLRKLEEHHQEDRSHCQIQISLEEQKKGQRVRACG